MNLSTFSATLLSLVVGLTACDALVPPGTPKPVDPEKLPAEWDVFHSNGGRFSVAVPKKWRSELEGGTSLTVTPQETMTPVFGVNVMSEVDLMAPTEANMAGLAKNLVSSKVCEGTIVQAKREEKDGHVFYPYAATCRAEKTMLIGNLRFVNSHYYMMYVVIDTAREPADMNAQTKAFFRSLTVDAR